MDGLDNSFVRAAQHQKVISVSVNDLQRHHGVLLNLIVVL